MVTTRPRKKPLTAPLWLALSAFVLAFIWNSPAMAIDHSHSAFSNILQQQVSNGRVNYDALKAKPAALKSYLDTLAAVDKNEFNGWNDNQQMAFLTNLYNAATLQLIVDNYPVKSIKKIGGLFSSPWKQKVVRLFGDKVTLDNVEHDILRKDYSEARLHFALVCAAKGCPPLRPEAYEAGRFSKQLDDQGRIYMADSSINRVEDNGSAVSLSKIFDWFSGDFKKQSGSVIAFVKPYLPNGMSLKSDASIRYSSYDWSLNDQ